jgi:hypothetical protein
MRLGFQWVWVSVLMLSSVAVAEVTQPHLGLTLVKNPGRATLIIRLCEPGIKLRATKYEEKKKTAKSWGTLLGMQAAVNADFFNFPEATVVHGRAKGDFEWWPPGTNWNTEQVRPYWQIGGDAVDLIDPGTLEPNFFATDIIGAHNTLMNEGVLTSPWNYDEFLLYGTYKRTGMGLSQNRRTMVWMVSHNAITATELVLYMQADVAEAGASPLWWVSNQDGGGSSQLWIENGGFVMPSTRQVANHLGVWALGFGSEAPSNCAKVPYEGSLEASTFPFTIEGLGSQGTVLLKWGETQTGTISFTNTGTSEWKPNWTKLAPTPRDVAHPLAAVDWIAPIRISTVPSVVQPGETAVFPLSIRGNTPGAHTLHLTLLEEQTTWFADEPLGGGPNDTVISIQVTVTNEAFCQPTCAGKDCGSDGCGGSCGTCAPGTQCIGDLCVCAPNCTGKECGSNGCDGTCGTCAADQICQDALCVSLNPEPASEPQPELQPEQEAQPEQEPQPETAPEPQPEQSPQPDLAPVPDPEPVSDLATTPPPTPQASGGCRTHSSGSSANPTLWVMLIFFAGFGRSRSSSRSA